MKDILPKDTIYFPEQPDNVKTKVTWTGKVHYRLRRPYCYIWEHDGVERAIFVKKGFKNDGASVPRWIQTIAGLHQDSVRSAHIIHDLVYAYMGNFPNIDGAYYRKDKVWKSLNVQVPREAADKLFARIMREDGISKNLRRRAYRAVRVFGWVAWN